MGLFNLVFSVTLSLNAVFKIRLLGFLLSPGFWGMDKAIIDCLAAAEADYELKDKGVHLPIQISDRGVPLPLEEKVIVLSGKVTVPLERLKKISDLFSGNRQPPDFKHGPTKEFVLFFVLIERMAWDFCVSTKRIERDGEFERLYNLLRRRPDGLDFNPLFSYLQGTVRLYMSLRDVSQAEFEAVASRLAKSAKTFSEGPTSMNYFNLALKTISTNTDTTQEE